MINKSIVFLFASLFAIFLFAQLPTFEPHDSSAPIDISANSFQSLPGDWVVASGDVVIRQKDLQLTADTMKVNRRTGEVIAEGNVVLIREGQDATRSDRIVYNYKTGRGVSTGLDVQSHNLRVISGLTKRDQSGLLLLSDVLLTTCTNDPSCLHYAVTAKRGDFMPEQYVAMSGAKVRFLDIPIFYYPHFRRSLVDHFGWRFIPGYESDWGVYLLTTYKTQLVDLGGEFHDSINSYTHFDYRSERGFALGEDITWSFGDPFDGGSRGKIGVYGIFDDDPMNPDFDRYDGRDIAEDTRYRITFRHDTYFTPSDYLTLRTSFFSDSYVMPDFYEEEYEDYIQPESYASFTHNGEYISYGIGINHRMNKFYQNVNRLPDAWLDTTLLELGNSGIYYESRNSGGLLQSEEADYDLEGVEARDTYESFRFDTLHQLTYPFKSFGFLSVVPRASYRGTYYSKTLESFEETYIDPITTNAATKTSYKDGDAELRSLFELGAEISFKAYGFYEGVDGGIYRHVIEPYANWTYIPEPNLRPDDLYQFDSIDRLDKGHYIRTGVRQLVQHKTERKIGSPVQDIIDVDLYAIYYFEDENDESGVNAYGVDVEWNIAKNIKIDADALYDAELEDFDHIDFWISLWQGERWEAAGQCYFIPNDTTLFRGDIRCNLSERWAFGSYIRYDSEISRCEKIAGYLQYNLDCISFRFRTEFEPAFEFDDGSERDAKLSFSFNAWLRAYTPPRYERKLRDKYWDD